MTTIHVIGRKVTNQVVQFASYLAIIPASISGTEAWSAPEVIHGGQISTKTDIWALGLTIWEMMALMPPHSLDETMDSMEMNDSVESGEDWFCERYGKLWIPANR